MVIGLFTTQAQIDEAPAYATGVESLDNLKLGSLKLKDKNPFNTIASNDVVDYGFLKVDDVAHSTELVIVSPTYGVEEPEFTASFTVLEII